MKNGYLNVQMSLPGYLRAHYLGADRPV